MNEKWNGADAAAASSGLFTSRRWSFTENEDSATCRSGGQAN